MISSPEKGRADDHGFVFVGDHPAIDFANTLVLDQGQPLDNFRSWADIVKWLSLAGLTTDGLWQIPASGRATAHKEVLELRQAWKSELERIAGGGKVSDGFIARLNRLLAQDTFHEVLHRSGKTGFHLEPSASKLGGEKRVLALLARQIARFLGEANFEYLHRCANTASCVLYFYDTTKNHRRQWCSTATCGNRHKVAEFRRRQSKVKS